MNSEKPGESHHHTNFSIVTRINELMSFVVYLYIRKTQVRLHIQFKMENLSSKYFLLLYTVRICCELIQLWDYYVMEREKCTRVELFCI